VFKRCTSELLLAYSLIPCACVCLIGAGYRSVIRSAVGIRLVELRKGSVCHHWEFLAENLPTEFVISIDAVPHLVIDNDVEMVVVVEDSAGAVLKRKFLPDELRGS